MASIEVVVAREILDSRGNPTVEVEVGLDLAGLLAERVDGGHRVSGANLCAVVCASCAQERSLVRARVRSAL